MKHHPRPQTEERHRITFQLEGQLRRDLETMFQSKGHSLSAGLRQLIKDCADDWAKGKYPKRKR